MMSLGHNIFFAICPPLAIVDGIDRFNDCMLKSDASRRGRVARERLHISLNSLGSYASLPADLIAKVCKAVSKLMVRSFVLSFNRLMSFQNKKGLRPYVLTGDDGLIGADMLYQAIHELLVKTRFIARSRKPHFRPHLTLWRDKNLLNDDFIGPVTWPVREFRLIHSPYGESRHNVLGCWPLVE